MLCPKGQKRPKKKHSENFYVKRIFSCLGFNITSHALNMKKQVYNNSITFVHRFIVL